MNTFPLILETSQVILLQVSIVLEVLTSTMGKEGKAIHKGLNSKGHPSMMT